MSKIKIEEPFKDFEGNVIPGETEGSAMTLKDIVVKAILLGNPDERDGDAKYKAYQLAQRFNAAKNDIELEASDIILVKKIIGQMYPSPLVVGIAYDILEGK